MTLAGLTIDAGSIAAPSAPRKSKRIEFIGDSSTAGMCNLATPGTSPADWRKESFAKSWPNVICELLDAECSTGAISGYGLTQNCCGKTGPVQMPEVWTRTLATMGPPTSKTTLLWDFSKWVPHALVVNLGTNDGRHQDSPQFVQAYINLVVKAHKVYGDDLHVFLACGPMDVKYCPAVNATIANVTAMGIKAHFLDQTYFFNGTFGGKTCGHPSAEVDAAMGKYNSEFIASKLGW